MSFIGAILFFIVVILIGLFPFPLIYGLSNVFLFLASHVFRYRKSVVVNNLKFAFPDDSVKELNQKSRLFYKNFSDILIEGIKAFTLTRRQVLNRYKIINPEILDQFYCSGQSVIGATGHYANWEWGSLAASLQTKYKVVAFYKQLSNKYIDRFVRWSRSRFGTELASIKNTAEGFEKFKDERALFLMVADQSVPKKYRDNAIWVQFLNRDTAFLHGVEKYARLNSFPVVYADVQRVKRGYYTVELSVLTTKPLELKEGELTEIYARKLESVIHKKPEDWLWSHRRWKLIR